VASWSRPMRIGLRVEVATLVQGREVWRPAWVQHFNSDYATFAMEDGSRPAYGPADEGHAWRWPTDVCPTCGGSGRVAFVIRDKAGSDQNRPSDAPGAGLAPGAARGSR